jgi:RNA-directed DNA polymerase
MTQCVNWVLDADIRKFFDSVDHEWRLRLDTGSPIRESCD